MSFSKANNALGKVDKRKHHTRVLSDLSKTSHKILLVDDEPDITGILKLGLEKAGYQVDTYNDPVQASAHFKPDYYNLIILDIRMPVMNGFQLAREIWAKDPNAQVCFLSSFEIYQEEAKKVFANLKSDCFIKKPILPSALAEHIAKHVEQR